MCLLSFQRPSFFALLLAHPGPLCPWRPYRPRLLWGRESTPIQRCFVPYALWPHSLRFFPKVGGCVSGRAQLDPPGSLSRSRCDEGKDALEEASMRSEKKKKNPQLPNREKHAEVSEQLKLPAALSVDGASSRRGGSLITFDQERKKTGWLT